MQTTRNGNRRRVGRDTDLTGTSWLRRSIVRAVRADYGDATESNYESGLQNHSLNLDWDGCFDSKPGWISLASLPQLFFPLCMRLFTRLLSHTRRQAMILSEHSIKLNPTEAQFVALLDDFAGRQDPPVECRIAGGWVRDKVSQRSIG